MRPQPDDTTVRLPVTFDYSGGRHDSTKGNLIFAGVLLLIGVVLTILFVGKEMSLLPKFAVIAFIWSVFIFFIRFKVLHEKRYSDAYESLKQSNNILSTESFWGIYEIDGSYPYICHFKDGKNGIFVRLEKDVVVGKGEDVAYNHFEAISEAYNLAGDSNINLCQIDYMDTVGNDVRLQGLYDGLSDCSNPDMKNALLSIYSNLQDEMSSNYASFDVYLFTASGKSDRFWFDTKAVIDRLLAGNYISFKVLDIEGIRSTCMALFNLHNFSALEACDQIFSTSRHRGIVPIRIEHFDGSATVLNRTQEEIRLDRIQQEQNALNAKRNKRKPRNKRGTPTKDKTSKKEAVIPKEEPSSSDDLDLFD